MGVQLQHSGYEEMPTCGRPTFRSKQTAHASPSLQVLSRAAHRMSAVDSEARYNKILGVVKGSRCIALSTLVRF